MSADWLATKLDALPASPGVYVFRDRKGGTLYVGKASSLRNRVRSYFQPGTTDTRYFIPNLAAEIGDLETIVCASEKEAALLENQLIKENQPRYNVKLRDDKQYLSLRLDPGAAWPRLEVVRNPRADRALYFGPYHSATAARQTLRLVNRHFQLRTCTDAEMKSRVRPCLQYQIGRCPAPCVMEVDRAEYGEQVKHVAMFLAGKHDELVDALESKMRAASGAMEYERAAVYRDQLRAIDAVREEQRVATARDVDQDVVGVFREADRAEVAVLIVREGKLVSVHTFPLEKVELPDEELVASFVGEYYGRASFVPDEVLLPREVDAMQGLADVLSERRGKKVQVLAPQRGARAKLVAMATTNAEHAYKEKRRAEGDVERRLAEVMRKLRLPKVPRRIECADVSHTGGEDTVAAVVAMKDGAPDRARYRSFHVKRVRGGDDYGAMYEVLSRRFRRGRDNEQGWDLPDLFVVDGGKGQLGVALAVLRDLGVSDLPVAALAKEKDTMRGDKVVDRVYLPGQKNPIVLRENGAALYVLAMARDEAHRVSNALREKLAKRRKLRSGLEDMPGIGKKTATTLLKTLGSLRAVSAASEEELRAAGASKTQARVIWRSFHGTPLEEKPVDAKAAEEAAIEHAFGRELVVADATRPPTATKTDDEDAQHETDDLVVSDDLVASDDLAQHETDDLVASDDLAQHETDDLVVSDDLAQHETDDLVVSDDLVTEHRVAAEDGADVLEEGGNAEEVDATPREAADARIPPN